MTSRIDLGDLCADLVRKDIKNVHLRVEPPDGRVRISAPTRMPLDTIRVLAISKLGWIKRHQTRLREQARATPREVIDLESVYVWGQRYPVERRDRSRGTRVELRHTRLILSCRPDGTDAERRAALDRWYREQTREEIPALLEEWEPRLGVQSDRVSVRRMKTRWGSCTPAHRTIRINSELAKRPIECLEMVLVHELAHLIERTHNARFIAIMDQHLPDWRDRRQILNALPIR